jgi:hypothetical protein
MAAWSRLMPSVLDAVLAAGARVQVRRYCLHILLLALAGLVAVMGFAMLVAGIFLRLAECMTMASAAAVTGGGLLLAAGLVALTAWLLSRRAARPALGAAAAPDWANGSAAVIAELLVAAEAAIQRDARAESPRFAILALLAGCALGASPKLRRILADLVPR